MCNGLYVSFNQDPDRYHSRDISTTGDQPGRCSCTQGAHVGVMRVKIHRPINSSASLAYCMSFPGLADAGTMTNELAASTCWAAIFNILVHRFPH